jgi:CheY-like chemotaxis protein
MRGPAGLMSSERQSVPSATTGGVLRPKNGHQRASTILVVEDEILARMAAADCLRDCGYRVLEAADADEARILLRASEPIEVVFSDITMPGMNGLALAAWIAKEFPDVKIVLTSGDSANAPAARAFAIFVPKPYDFGTLARVMKQLV